MNANMILYGLVMLFVGHRITLALFELFYDRDMKRLEKERKGK